MEQHAYFWSHFEEPAGMETATQNMCEKTQTRQREEPDQDPHHLGYVAIPRSAPSASIKTQTEAREEPDQDLSCQSYRSFKHKS